MVGGCLVGHAVRGCGRHLAAAVAEASLRRRRAVAGSILLRGRGWLLVDICTGYGKSRRSARVVGDGGAAIRFGCCPRADAMYVGVQARRSFLHRWSVGHVGLVVSRVRACREEEPRVTAKGS
jgi:hypothetical protein